MLRWRSAYGIIEKGNPRLIWGISMNQKILAAGIAAALSIASISSMAATVSLNTAGTGAKTNRPIALPSAAASTVTITESTDSSTITTNNSVSCNNGVGHADNSYYRAFQLSTFPALNQGAFRVDSVTFGVETASSTGGTQPATVNLYSSSSTTPTLASLTLLTTTAVTIPDGSASTLTVNFTTPPALTVATDTLVVELFTPNGEAVSNLFFIGSNAAGQSAPGYIKASDCGINDITDLSTVGFGSMDIVMTVTGNTQATTPVRLQDFKVD